MMAVGAGIIEIDTATIVLAWLKKKYFRKIADGGDIRHSRPWTSLMLFSNENTVASDENARE